MPFESEANIQNKLEELIIQVMRKQGVFDTIHETGIVVKQLSPTLLLVGPQQFDKDPEEIPCAQQNGRYNEGDRVLITYINNDAHQKFVIAVLQKGYEKEEVDYSKLKDTPVRLFRKPGIITQDEADMIVDLGDEKPIGLVWKMLYDEKSPMQWWETLERDGKGRLFSITTYWPPNGSVRFTNYVVRDEDGLMKYFGPSPTA